MAKLKRANLDRWRLSLADPMIVRRRIAVCQPPNDLSPGRNIKCPPRSCSFHASNEMAFAPPFETQGCAALVANYAAIC